MKRDFFDQFSSDEEDDNEKRVVRSVREKRYEAIATSAKTVQNNVKIADWTAVSNGATIDGRKRADFSRDARSQSGTI